MNKRSGNGTHFIGENKKKKITQKYRTEWEQQAEFKGWLKPSSDNTKAMCIACNKKQMTADISVIRNHAKSSHHQSNVQKIAPDKQRTIEQTVSFNKERVKLEKDIKVAEILITTFLAEHNIAFLATDHLTKILKVAFPDSAIARGMRLGRTKATNILNNAVGPVVAENIYSTLKTKKFSVLIDESTDTSSTKSLCVCARFYNEQLKKIDVRTITLLEVFEDSNSASEGATGAKLYDKLMSVFTTHGVPLNNLIGFASDGCNTMMGSNNSVASRLVENVPGIKILKCICHSLHLCSSEACKLLPRQCEALARDIYNFFKNSCKRAMELKEFQEFCEVEPHKLLRMSQTRWLSILSVVKRINEQWMALKLYFDSKWIEHRLSASENIHNALNDHSIRIFYIFLEWILPKFVKLNEYFQTESVVITELHTRMCETYKELLLVYLRRSYVLSNDLGDIDPTNETNFVSLNEMYLGIGVINFKVNLNGEQLTDFYVRCRNFVIKACLELKKRYNFKDSLLANLFIFSPQCAYDKKPNSIISIMKEVPRIINDEAEMQLIDDQWRNLLFNTEISPEIKSLRQPDEYWVKLGDLQDFSGNFFYKELSRFVLDVFSLPHSNATCERVFSKVNLIKTKIRNRMSVKTINSVVIVSEEIKRNGCCYDFKPSEEMLRNCTSDVLYLKNEEKIEEDNIWDY